MAPPWRLALHLLCEVEHPNGGGGWSELFSSMLFVDIVSPEWGCYFAALGILHIGSLIPVDVSAHAYSRGSYDLFITCSFT